MPVRPNPKGADGLDAAIAAGTANVADLLTRAADRWPQRTAYVAGASRPNWAEVDATVTERAAGLIALGLGPGDRIALVIGNTLDFPVVYFAALRAGLTVVPVNIGYTGRELTHVLTDAGVSALVGARGVLALAASIVHQNGGPVHLISTDAADTSAADATATAAPVLRWGELRGAVPDGGFPARGGTDLAVLIYTSGTSGTPRGAMLAHRTLLANLDQVRRAQPAPVEVDDVVLLVLPLFHIYGLNTGLGLAAAAGATGVLVERFEPMACLDLMGAERVSILPGAPPMYLTWTAGVDRTALRKGCRHVRLALSGASPLPGEALARMREVAGVVVFEGYGLTETAPVLTSTLMSGMAVPNSIGRPIPGVEVRLCDSDGGPLEDEADTGQIVVRGDNVFAGYWPDAADGPDADGWFATGDIAFGHENGDLYLVDRVRDLILVSGFNVYPREVEQVLVGHPGIVEAAVIGVPDPISGESVRAVVVGLPGRTPTAAQVMAHAAASLARFKCPTSVEFADTLPHSITGKVSKARLRELGFATGGPTPGEDR